MSHMVIYRGPDSKVGYHQTDDIHDAVGFVEQLRNDQGVEHARIFRLEEVTFEYRPYYRVELKSSPSLGAAEAPPAVEAAPSEPMVEAPAVVEAAAASTPPSPPKMEEVKSDIKVETKPDKKPEAKVDPKAPPATDSGNGVGARRGLFGR